MGRFIESIIEKLQRHPKRILFPEGDEPRVLEAAAEYVRLKLGPAIVLGSREKIEQVAQDHRISLSRIHIIEPDKADDLSVFMKCLERLPRYRGISHEEADKILRNPNYFATMMLLNSQCDGLVAGVGNFSGTILRPLIQLIRPLPGVRSISSCMIMDVPDCPYGDDGVFFFADAGVIPNPSVEQLAGIAVETARLKRQITGMIPRVAMLSYSTKGSAQTTDTDRMVAATAMAIERIKEIGLEAEVDGELQVDAAIIPQIADMKAPDSTVAGKADVLIFPDLSSANIAVKLVQRLAKARAYGQVLIGLERPAAEVSRGATVEDILGVAAVVALQAVEYRKLYPHQEPSPEFDPLPPQI